MSARVARPPTSRSFVSESRKRCLTRGVDPTAAAPSIDLEGPDLAEHLGAHRMASVLPVVDSLLVPGVVSSGHIVAVGDETGRLLTVIGDRQVRARAESMAFMPGAIWSDDTVGANAPGLALRHDTAVRVAGEEHFLERAHSWSCSAAPVHDPATGRLVGILDVTGPESAASDEMLALVRATALLAENELRTSAGLVVPGAADPAAGEVGPEIRLQVLGAGAGRVAGPASGPGGSAGATRMLTRRHAEICVLLDAHSDGLTSGALAELLADDRLDEVSVRAEVSRLRRALGHDTLCSRPYRLRPGAVATDAHEVSELLGRGDVVGAVRNYPGPVLPESDSPGVADVRDELHGRVRAAALWGGVDALAEWTAGPGRDDMEALLALSRDSRAGDAAATAARARYDALDRSLGA